MKFIRVSPHLPGKLTINQFRRTPFGSLPETILHSLGVFDAITADVAKRVTPYCSRCDRSIVREELDVGLQRLLQHPAAVDGADGFYALAVLGTDELPLSVHMEMLEADRAIVDGFLLTQDELVSGSGSPVLSIAQHPEGLMHSLNRWIASGGQTISAYYFSSRRSEGIEVQSFSRGLRCEGCGDELKEFDPHYLVDLPDCGRCRGKGWLLSVDRYDNETLQGCPDCHGAGAISPLFDYRLGEVRVRDLLTLSAGKIRSYLLPRSDVTADATPSSWSEVLEVFALSPLADYAIGTPIAFLGYDERFILTAIQCVIARYRGRSLLFDLGSLSAAPPRVALFFQDQVIPHCAAEVRAAVPSDELPLLLSPSTNPESVISDVIEQGVTARSFSLPSGQNTFILGGIGGEHVKLLSAIQNRFQKRKKFSASTNFYRCNALTYIAYPAVAPVLFADLLGVTERVAETFSATAAAQRAGLAATDFNPVRALSECPGCGHERRNGCLICCGAGYDWRLSSVSLGSVSYPEALQLPLKELVDSIVLDDVTDFIIRELFKESDSGLPVSTTLATSTAFLEPGLARYYYIVACLHSVVGSAKMRGLKRTVPLVLIEDPFTGAAELDRSIAETLKGVCDGGGTVVCAGGTLRYPEYFAKFLNFRGFNHPVQTANLFHERYGRGYEVFEYATISG